MPQVPSSPKPDHRVLEQLAKLVDPLGLLVLTRERVLEAFDDAVRRGRMTRSDAQELATALINLSRQSTDEVLSELEQRFGLQRPGARTDRRSAAALDVPIADYDELTAVRIIARLGDLTPEELQHVREHEQRNANRKTVLQAVDRQLDR
jgi:polyhydroxyalkanoate synthesis regulator phasin